LICLMNLEKVQPHHFLVRALPALGSAWNVSQTTSCSDQLSTSPADGYCVHRQLRLLAFRAFIDQAACTGKPIVKLRRDVPIATSAGASQLSLIAWSTLGISVHGSLWHKYPAIVCWFTFTCFTMRLSKTGRIV